MKSPRSTVWSKLSHPRLMCDCDMIVSALFGNDPHGKVDDPGKGKLNRRAVSGAQAGRQYRMCGKTRDLISVLTVVPKST